MRFCPKCESDNLIPAGIGVKACLACGTVVFLSKRKKRDKIKKRKNQKLRWTGY